MKTSLTKLSSSLLLVSFSLAVWAKPVAQVLEVSGTVFVITPDGKTSALKKNDHVEDKSEIMAEEGATISLNDYYDATYHLTGGAHLKIFNKSVQLKKGKTWVQSRSKKYPLALTTANAQVGFSTGEFITTFDQVTNRTQVLVVNGEVEASNILDQNMKYTVAAGTFTLIDPEIESGVPRAPTKVGLQSLNAALSEFKTLPEDFKIDPKRSIASVETPGEEVKKKGEIIFITSSRLPASVDSSLSKKYFKKLTKKDKNLSPAPIRFFGTSFKKAEPIAPRAPASIRPETPNLPQKSALPSPQDQEFGQSLKKPETEQPKYGKDLQNLINDLRNF